MRPIIGGVALALMAAGVGQAEVRMHGPAATAEAVLKAERAFDAMSASEGTAKAFRAFMDPVDGLVFAGGEPARGAEAIYKAQGGDAPGKAKLHWTPDEVFASTGDMAVTWGHWTLTATATGKTVIKGRYVTVWRRNSQGEWKGIVDIGDHD
jgi:ketosteroid isomerase-like protein